MGTITLTLPVAGQEITAGLHSGNYAALQTLLNGDLDNTNINASAAVDLTKLASAAWSTYVPVWSASGTAVAIGNSTILGRYVKVGRFVAFTIRVAFGTTATFGTGNYFFTLPVAASTTSPWTTNASPIGNAYAFDSSGGVLNSALAILQSSTTLSIQYPLTYPTGGQGLYGQLAPWTWDDPDTIHVTGAYESAA